MLRNTHGVRRDSARRDALLPHCPGRETREAPAESARAAKHAPPAAYLISTGAPTGTRLNRSITSGTCMRMQPCDAPVPME